MTDLSRCADIEERLPLYVGGDLDPEGLETVRVHLSRCTACSERYEVVQRARGALVAALRASDLPSAGTPEDSLWPGVRAILEREGRLASPPTRGPREIRPTPLFSLGRRASLFALPAAAAAVLFLVFGPGRGVPGAAEGEGSGAPFRGPSVATDGSFVGAPLPVGASVPLPPGVLRRLAPGEATLQDTAIEMPVRVEPLRPGVATPNSLAGYR